MQQVAVKCQSKNIKWNRSMACRDTIGLLTGSAYPDSVYEQSAKSVVYNSGM